MDYSFPPAPPGDTSNLAARWLLAGISLIGLGILMARISQWKFIKHREMIWWTVAAGICWLVAGLGYCRFVEWDANAWLVPIMTAVMSVYAAAMTVGLIKLYLEGFFDLRHGLAVIGIFVLTSVLLLAAPAVGSHKAARKLVCMNNLRQNGIALLSYQGSFGTVPPPISQDGLTSWRVRMLPLLDHTSLFREYDQKVAWDRPPNATIAEQYFSFTFQCPSNYFPRDDLGRQLTNFSMPTGPHTMGDNPLGTKESDITDGTSNTLLLVEGSGAQIVWTEPREVNVESQPTGINLNGNKPGHSTGWLSGYHRGGVNVQMVDGGIRFLSVKTDPALLKKLASIDEGEDVRPIDF